MENPGIEYTERFVDGFDPDKEPPKQKTPIGDYQSRAVALREAVASMPEAGELTVDQLRRRDGLILQRADRFTHYIETGEHDIPLEDDNG